MGCGASKQSPQTASQSNNQQPRFNSIQPAGAGTMGTDDATTTATNTKAPPPPPPTTTQQPAHTTTEGGDVSLTKISDLNRPMPSMLWDPACPLIPAQGTDVQGKITVVLDLDETLIHAEAQKTGPPEVTPRPHVSKLLEVSGKCTEVVVWTSSSRLQAHFVVRQIDAHRVVRHCVYKHRKWMPANPRVQGYTKDLRLMGRDMDRILIVENTPDCILLNPANGILVEDFNMKNTSDNTLLALAWIIQDMSASGKTVPNYLCSCPLVHRRQVLLHRTGEPFMAYCMDSIAALEKWSPAEITTSAQQSDALFTQISDKQNSGKLWDACRKDLQGMGMTQQEMEEIPAMPEEGGEGAAIATVSNK